LTTAATAATVPKLERVGPVTQARVMLSEWTKLRSLRSTRWSLLAAVVLTVGLPSLFAAILAARWGHLSPQERAGHRHRPVEVALAGVNVSQLAIAVLGVLVVTGEYSTGMIRASFIGVPKRLPVLWAKTAVYAFVAFALMLLSVIAAFFASQAILHRHHILQIPFTSPGVARAVIGGAVYLTLVGIFALAIGTIVRNTAGGIATFAAIFFVIPPLLDVLPASWIDAVSPYPPSSAGRSLFQLTHGPHALAPAPGGALLTGYSVLVLAVAAVLLVHRDTY
jgi:ABC-2 type transport system permease protein